MVAKSRGTINGFSRSGNVICITELSFKLSDVKESQESCLFRSVKYERLNNRLLLLKKKKKKPNPNEFTEELISSSAEF